MAPKISLSVKPGSRSEQPLTRFALFVALLLLSTRAVTAEPVTAAFANGIADARSVQPLRLVTDLGGRERQVQLVLSLPAGAHLNPPIVRFTSGSRVHVQILDLYVPAGSAAGPFTVRGTVIDGTQRWPFQASIRIRANPHVVVRDEDAGFSLVQADETVRRTWRVTNNGNVHLDLLASAMPTGDTTITVEPARLLLAPGENREVVLTARLDRPPDRLTKVPLFLNLDSGSGDLRHRETVGFTAEFVPLAAGTGPLFAEFTGEVLLGGFTAAEGHGRAASFRVEGEILPATQLIAFGADGVAAPGGSHLGLATRDYVTASLTGTRWAATAGLVAPPTFGFLETSTQGRGGTLAWFADGSTLTLLQARERFGDFRREHTGLHFAHVNVDQSGWSSGLLAQRNQAGTDPRQERIGAFAQADWLWRRITGSSQIAAARDNETHSARFGLEQRLDYRSVDDRSSAGVFVQTAPAGFFLDGRSSELRDASVVVAASANGRFNFHWSESREQGRLRSYRESETDAGLAPTDPEFIELITRTGSAVDSQSAGYEFTFNDSRTQLAASETHRTRDTSLTPVPEDSYRERAATVDWSRAYRDGQLLLTAATTAGTEANARQNSGFAEAAFTAGGNLRANLQLTTELRRTWHTGGDVSAGYRQPGTYGRVAVTWIPRPRWRFEAGLDGYKFGASGRRTRGYAILEAPVTNRVSFATEASHDDERTAVWLVARIHFKAQMPWRPVRGAFSGRIREIGGQPVAGARLALDGGAGLTAADGRFTLPGRPPGTYPLTWNLPTGYVSPPDWPQKVVIEAGRLQLIELTARRTSSLRGTVAITRDGEIERPTGPVGATDAAGRIFEAMAAAGDFELLLAPGHYTVRYTGEENAAVATQLMAEVEIGAAGQPVQVHLSATESARGMRRTFFRDDAAAPKVPVGP